MWEVTRLAASLFYLYRKKKQEEKNHGGERDGKEQWNETDCKKGFPGRDLTFLYFDTLKQF